MTSFLSRSFRRTLHLQHEGKIVKNISAGQNLAVCVRRHAHGFLLQHSFFQIKDQTWEPLSEAGGWVEDEEESTTEDLQEKDGPGAPQSFNEKQVLAGEVAMHLAPPTHDIE